MYLCYMYSVFTVMLGINLVLLQCKCKRGPSVKDQNVIQSYNRKQSNAACFIGMFSSIRWVLWQKDDGITIVNYLKVYEKVALVCSVSFQKDHLEPSGSYWEANFAHWTFQWVDLLAIQAALWQTIVL